MLDLEAKSARGAFLSLLKNNEMTYPRSSQHHAGLEIRALNVFRCMCFLRLGSYFFCNLACMSRMCTQLLGNQGGESWDCKVLMSLYEKLSNFAEVDEKGKVIMKS